MRTLRKIYIGSSVILALSVLIYMAVSRTPLFSDGASWIYSILNGKWFRYDAPHMRYSSHLFQFLSVLTINLSPTVWGKELAIDLFSFSYVFHPAISLLACYLILRKDDRTYLIVYPLLTSASVVFSTLLLGVGIASEALSFFWPLLFIILKKEHRYWHVGVVLALSVALSYSYELSVGLLLLGLVTNIVQPEKTLTRKLISVALLVGVINILSTIYSLYSLKSNNFWFMSSFMETWTINLKMLLAMGCLFFVSSFLSNRSVRYSSQVFYLLSILILALGLFKLSLVPKWGDLMWAAHHARTIVVPAGFVIALMMLVLEGYLPRIRSPLTMSPEVRGFFLMATICLLNFGSVYNIIVTSVWRRGLKEVEAEMGRRDMCYVIDRNYFESTLLPLGVSEWNLPQLTSSLSKDLKLKTLLFSKMRLNGRQLINFNSCHSLHRNILFSKETRYIAFEFFIKGNQLFDFSHIIKNVKPLYVLLDHKNISGLSSMTWQINSNGSLPSETYEMIKGEEYRVSISHSSTGFDHHYAHALIRLGDKVIYEFSSQPEPKTSSFNFVAEHTGDFPLEIIFDNDLWESDAKDVNLKIIELKISPVRDSMVKIIDSSAMVLYTNGAIQTQFFDTHQGHKYKVLIRHSSSGFDHQFAHAVLRLGDKVIYDFMSQAEPKIDSLSFVADHTGRSALEILFDNDRFEGKDKDINLTVHDVKIIPEL